MKWKIHLMNLKAVKIVLIIMKIQDQVLAKVIIIKIAIFFFLIGDLKNINSTKQFIFFFYLISINCFNSLPFLHIMIL